MTQQEKQEMIDGLVLRYVLGEISEAVFEASLHTRLPKDEIRHLVLMNQIAHRNSMPYRRGEVT